MRERISMKSKMLGALALFTLIGALFILQSAGTGPPTVNAAAGSIDALNVGTCLTTDDTVFKGDCDMLSNDDTGTDNDWEVREKIAKVTTLYATYAHDPKTASDEPRAILTDSDLLKISIADTGRDKRSGVLIGGGASVSVLTEDLDNVSTNPETPTTLGAAIKKDLDDGDGLNYPDAAQDIEYTPGDFNFTVSGEDPVNTVSASGNKTINFGRRSGAEDFLPGDFDVENGAVVRFFGCIDKDNDSTVGNNDAPDGNCDDAGETIVNLKNYIEVDEDASNGEASGNTPPWLGINASVPADSEIVIYAIYYRTSDRENLVGGQKYHYCDATLDAVYEDADNDQTDKTNWRCKTSDETVATPDIHTPAENRDVSATNVVYTSDEKSDNDALLVLVKSDGDDTTQNLWLKETERFSGRYEGFVRLTDANGDGAADEDDTSTSNVNESLRMDWGLDTKDGSEEVDSDDNLTSASAAVLGVESGPVTVEYRDSDGKKQTLRIEIDNTPPAVTVANPANGGSSGDQSPDFAGTLEDADSGLADKSFRLVVDNEVDGDGKNDDFVVNKPTATGVTAGTAAVISHRGQYMGYSDNASTFGIVPASDLYQLGDDSCDNQADCYIESDEYDDGARRGTFDDSIRLDLQDGGKDVDTRDKEFEIDFQAFVMDMAGNIGFSDADAANPRLINGLGEKDSTKRKQITGNILGYYSAHIITLDEKDPDINEAQSVTGFYGLNADDKMIADRNGVMVVFDGPIAPSSVSNNTFSVELDDESDASVIAHEVDKNYVFLKLASELASDATPKIDIVQGEKVEDMAGNETFGREQDEFEAKDGISPKLTVTLSGGSGSGTGKEGPDKLTKDKITVHVSSDEALQGAPRIAVVCSSLRWNQGDDKEDASGQVAENEVGSGHNIGDYVANRNGSFTEEPSEDPVTTKPRSSNTKASGETYKYTCEYDGNDDNFGDNFIPTKLSSLARRGENWEHTWQNQSGADRKLNDGALTVVAFARDRSRYEGPNGNLQNWGSASAEFTLDTDLLSPEENGGGDLQPEDGGVSKESRPFVLIEFNEGTTVTLDSVELDDVEIADQFTMPAMNRFVYWPDTLAQGDHEVEVEASDAAGNEVTFDYEFKVVERGDFLIELQAGWNAISVPATPVDTAIGSVFTDAAVTTVIGWDTQGWRIAVRRDGVWESNQQYGALNDIQSKYGYWVKSDKFVNQPVALQGPIGRGRDSGSPGTPIGIDTLAGWNFVGVIDQDGDQTEDDFGQGLLSGSQPVTAGEYLGSTYIRAYTWDPTFSRFLNLPKDMEIKIGAGVWVYYEGGIAP